ncbi:hypothetical protein AHiyo8_15700 [Arthrobacter sp. Hiyo8]|nr:hypothetical protein AHiyo8_15700 [Arthrobacter sp. Hiyo8]
MPALEDLGAGRGGLADGDDEVLDGDGYAGELVQRFGFGTSGGAYRVHLGGYGERLFSVDVQECVDLPVNVGNPVQVRLGDLDGRDLARGQLGGQLSRGQADEFGVVQFSHSLSPHPGLPEP